MGMSARNHQCHIGRCKILILNIVRTNMSFDKVYANQRLSSRIRKRLCLRKPNQQRPHQSGTVGHADGIHFFQCHACVRQCLLNDTVNIFNMLSGCNLRHNAAV